MIDQVNWANISDAWKRKRRTRLTYVDLFSGAGGISKGFEMAGMEGIYGLDHFDSAVQTYARNFDHPIFNFQTLKAQNEISEIQGLNNTFFCGSYCGYGFHEDGLNSGIEISNKL